MLCTCSLLSRYSIATLILDKRPKAGDWRGCNPRQALIGADTGPGRSIDVPRNWNRREGMGFQPQCAGGCGRIYASFFPPGGFVARAMGFAMMAPAQRHGELIADLAAKRAVLGEAQMMGVCRAAPTNQARLFGHELDVLPVAKAAWLRMGQPALVNAVGIRCPRRPQGPLREP